MVHHYDELNDIINKYETFTILMHNNPDGDSISSMFVLQKILLKKNKKVHLAIHNIISENYKFWFDKYVGIIDIPNKKSECLIIVDTPTVEKTYEKYFDLGEFVVVIDHHKNSSKFGDLNVCKTTTCTGIILYEFIKHINFNIDKQMAEYLFISLCWDTDGLKNSFATHYVYNIAAELVGKGAVPQRVFRYLFEYKKRSELRVQRMLFNNVVELESINFLKISKNDSKLIDNNDIYNFLNYVKLLDTVDLFMVFIDRGNYMEIKINNNQTVYKYLKTRYNKLYRINIVNSFDKDVDAILYDLRELIS